MRGDPFHFIRKGFHALPTTLALSSAVFFILHLGFRLIVSPFLLLPSFSFRVSSSGCLVLFLFLGISFLFISGVLPCFGTGRVACGCGRRASHSRCTIVSSSSFLCTCRISSLLREGVKIATCVLSLLLVRSIAVGVLDFSGSFPLFRFHVRGGSSMSDGSSFFILTLVHALCC